MVNGDSPAIRRAPRDESRSNRPRGAYTQLTALLDPLQRTTFAAAAEDVGEKKALKEALKTARNYAEAAPHVRNLPYGSVGADAERAIIEMLGRT
jgi:hypothetical protein